MRRRDIDAAIREALLREAAVADYREPTDPETERAVLSAGPAFRGRGPAAPRGDRRVSAAWAAVLAAVLTGILAVRAGEGPDKVSGCRPLADSLSRRLPADAGVRFAEFWILAGESLRPAD